MYNELWRRTQILEGLSKDAMALSNATRRELQEGMRSVALQLSRYCALQGDKARPGSNSRDNIEVTLEKIRSSMSSYFQTIISTQHMFQDTCHRIQEYTEPVLEKYLAETLERIVELLTSNKCQSQVEDLHRLLKSHHSTVVRNVGHTTNTVLRAANNSTKEARNLATVINEAHEGLLVGTTDLQKGISGLQSEQQDVHQTLKEITAVMDDLQSKMSSLSNQSSSNDNYLKLIHCQASSNETNNITSELKRIFEDNQKHISREIHALTQSIIEMLKSIRVHIPPVDKPAGSTEQVKDFVNILTASNVQKYDDTLENGVILEAHEENMNSIYDAQKSQTETSVLQNFTNSHSIPQTNEHLFAIQMPQTLTQLETSTPRYPGSENNASSPELTINVISNSHHNDEKQSSNHNETSSLSGTGTGKHYASNQSSSQNESFVTIVHNDKPLTSEGQIIYLSKENATNEMDNEQNNPLNSHINKETNKHHTQRQQHTHLLNTHVSDSYRTNSGIKNHTTKETKLNGTDQPITSSFENVNSSASSSTPEALRANSTSETQNQDNMNRFPEHSHNSDSKIISHEVSSKNTPRNSGYADEHENIMNRSLANNSEHDTQNLNKLPSENSNGNFNETKRKNFNKNDTQHYLYRLLNKLEELSNRLMNSESTEISAPDHSEHTDHTNGSQEGNSEEHDYSLPDSSFSSN